MDVTNRRETAWVGVDIGKRHHWVCALDADGSKLLSVKVANDEAAILGLLGIVDGLAGQLVWAVASSVRRRRCCWRCSPRPVWRCGMRLDESWRR